MITKYVDTPYTFEEEVKTRLEQETVEAEPELAALIALAQELLLKNPSPKKEQAPSKQLSVDIENIGTGIKVESVGRFNAKQETIENIKQLGADILREAFECFGDEGPALIEEFHQAPTLDDKLSVCIKVENIVGAMADQSEHIFDEEGEETLRFSPFRISPKIIGRYPNIAVAPTCLGKSILTASFFTKLGLPVLHGGVVVAEAQTGLTAYNEGNKETLRQVEQRGYSLALDTRERIEKAITKNKKTIHTHRGFHAVTYTEIEEGTWIQLDPVFDYAFVTKDKAARLDETFGKLMVLQENDILAEIRLNLGKNASRLFADMVKDIGAALPTHEEIDTLLRETPSAETYRAILEKVFLPLLPNYAGGIEGNQVQTHVQGLINWLPLLDNISSKDYALSIIAEVMEDSVFHEARVGGFSESIERCKTDKAYRERRVADICVAPLLVALRLQYRLLAAGVTYPEAHPCVDLGVPEYRIGMCALSDIAAFYGDKLPLSTWLSYWPSQISLAEHFRQTPTTAQKLLAQTAIEQALRGDGNLTYLVLDDIFKKS